MDEKKFKPGDQVEIQALHLQGIKAKVLFEKDGLTLARISEHQYEGFICAFPASDFKVVE